MPFFEGSARDLVLVGWERGSRHQPEGALPQVNRGRRQPVSDLDAHRVVVGRRTRRGMMLDLDPGSAAGQVPIQRGDRETDQEHDDGGHRGNQSADRAPDRVAGRRHNGEAYGESTESVKPMPDTETPEPGSWFLVDGASPIPYIEHVLGGLVY